jgi:hypothetical protein
MMRTFLLLFFLVGIVGCKQATVNMSQSKENSTDILAKIKTCGREAMPEKLNGKEIGDFFSKNNIGLVLVDPGEHLLEIKGKFDFQNFGVESWKEVSKVVKFKAKPSHIYLVRFKRSNDSVKYWIEEFKPGTKVKCTQGTRMTGRDEVDI